MGKWEFCTGNFYQMVLEGFAKVKDLMRSSEVDQRLMFKLEGIGGKREI